jgi:hypothetical protein
VFSVDSITRNEAGTRKNAIATGLRDNTRLRDPPGSPVKLFMPDEFQFYTLDGHGQLVMKQMSKEEIQGMLAASVGSGGIIDDASDSLINPGQQQQVQVFPNGVSKVIHPFTSMCLYCDDNCSNMNFEIYIKEYD